MMVPPPAPQQFCLKWNDHSYNMVKTFSLMAFDQNFVDVTLACEGSSIKAHKVVLSACSNYFKDLFLSNPCKHPIVILKDMKMDDLKAIVEFMYKGEVNVFQHQLGQLLKVAEILKVKGLTETKEEEEEDEEDEESKLNQEMAEMDKENEPSQHLVPQQQQQPPQQLQQSQQSQQQQQQQQLQLQIQIQPQPPSQQQQQPPPPPPAPQQAPLHQLQPQQAPPQQAPVSQQMQPQLLPPPPQPQQAPLQPMQTLQPPPQQSPPPPLPQPPLPSQSPPPQPQQQPQAQASPPPQQQQPHQPQQQLPIQQITSQPQQIQPRKRHRRRSKRSVDSSSIEEGSGSDEASGSGSGEDDYISGDNSISKRLKAPQGTNSNLDNSNHSLSSRRRIPLPLPPPPPPPVSSGLQSHRELGNNSDYGHLDDSSETWQDGEQMSMNNPMGDASEESNGMIDIKPIVSFDEGSVGASMNNMSVSSENMIVAHMDYPSLSPGSTGSTPSNASNQGKICRCQHCGLTFTAYSSLRRHMQRHFADRERYVCDICLKSYSRKDYLKEHKKLKHPT